MRRVSVKCLLLSCATFLLAIDGCWSGPLGALRKTSVRAVAADDEGVPRAKEKGAPFRLPADQAGRLLGDVLPPAPHPGHLRNPRPPAPPPVPLPRLTDPEVRLPDSAPVVPRLPAPKRRVPLRPHLVNEEGLGEGASEPSLPRQPAFAVGRRLAVPSPDASLPPPLPIVARPLPDRVSLDDATAESSTAAVLAAPLPRRTRPAPFVPTRVPNPFPNRRPLTTKVPTEETTPQAGAAR